ncbi:hypothetical protein BKA63DRAFT_577172 [Paraphoma chrysanthemicola]|nr:hypothetical protein BKA63DRAFT_577172 [Paraphoma chrysanthemicola]
MKAEQIITLMGLASSVHAGPARRNCGQVKSFFATNECGLTYGGTWIECATGIFDIQTFTAPECPKPTSTTLSAYPNETITSISPTITTIPEGYHPTGYPTGNTTCSELWICVDAIAVCGSETMGYGACYDTCTSTTLVPPPCTLSSVTPASTTTSAVESTTTAMPTPPPREHKDLCDEKPFMCAPKGW